MFDKYLLEQDIKGEVVEYLLEMLTLETQPSVRSMVEWTLIRLILRDYTILESLWTEIGVTSEKKTATLCSMFTIITHVTRHTEDKLRQVRDRLGISEGQAGYK